MPSMRVGTDRKPVNENDAVFCAASEQRVDERCDGARLREDDQQPEQHEDDDDRHEPVFLLLAQEAPELRKHATFAHTALNTSANNAADRDSAPDTASSRGWRGG